MYCVREGSAAVIDDLKKGIVFITEQINDEIVVYYDWS